MSLPDKCPFCGAGVLVLAGGFKCRNEQCVTFDCRTWIHAGQADERRTQSSTCEDAERARLAARVVELEARCKRMQEIGDMIVDEYMVERAERDAWQQAKEAKP